MNDKRIWLAAAFLAFLATARLEAMMIAPPPPGNRVAAADLVVVGKVTGFGKGTKGEMFKGDARDMSVAKIKVGETLLGKGAKEIEVGYFPPIPPKPVKDRPVFVRPRPAVQLLENEEYLLVLVKHPTKKDLYVVANYYDATAKKGNPNFAKDVEAIKKAAKLLAKPTESLKSKDADERLQTASLLVARYRTNRTGQAKTEQVSADESKLILEVLANADWAPAKRPQFGQVTPMGVFFQLGLTEKDGWKYPQDATKVAEVAKKWCKDNAGKYRINRFVNETKEEKKEEK
jgi:hypothetical protein